MEKVKSAAVAVAGFVREIASKVAVAAIVEVGKHILQAILWASLGAIPAWQQKGNRRYTKSAALSSFQAIVWKFVETHIGFTPSPSSYIV